MTRNEGFSLIEMMVAVLILGVATAASFQVLNTQSRTFSSSERALDVQEDVRLVTDLIAFDTRAAGFMVPKTTAVASVDGGASASDRYCVSDSSYVDFPTSTQTSTVLDNVPDRWDRSTVSAFTTSSVTLDDIDIDRDGSTDFAGDAGILLSDGTDSHCARIASIASGTVTLVSGHEIPGSIFGTIGDVRAVPAVIYEVDDTNFELRRNNLVLATDVEDLQVEYWVDVATEDGLRQSSEFPVHDLNNASGLTMNTARVRSIRVSVITKATQPEGGPNQRYDLFSRPASANRTAGTADSFRRRRLTANVTPYNLVAVD